MKILFRAVIAALCILAGEAALAAGIVGTKHDMTAIPTQLGAVPGTSNICVYCHTPHTSGSLTTALWNKPDIPTTYTPYSSATLHGSISGVMGTQTRLCLSCHDGSLAVYVIVTPPSGGGYVTGLSEAPAGWNLTADGGMYGPAIMDRDFSNDHPVSITYDTRQGDLVNPPPAAFPLYSNLVECATCHDAHDNANPPFLRISNAGSAMCLACHNL
jgi:predicted CXXCH cytochrome family protein